MRTTIATAVALGIVTLWASSGCGRSGSNQADIRGEVKLDGRSLDHGSILFTPTDGAKGVVRGGAIENGRYQLLGKAGPVVGPNRVEIRAAPALGAAAQKGRNPLDPGAASYAELVAPRYNAQSALKVTVAPGDNTADFSVESK